MVNALGPVGLLVISNIFMTYAWYGHLKDHKNSALWLVVLISWGVAFFEYCFQVPANRWGHNIFTLSQLKILQEVITMVVFAGFSYFYMKMPLKLDYLWASICLIGAVYFVFRSN